MTKQCRRCGETKPHDAFRPGDPKKTDSFGLRAWCRECDRVSRREWRLKNLDRERDKDRLRRLADPEHHKQRIRDWRQRAKQNGTLRDWWRDNPELALDAVHRRRARMHAVAYERIDRRAIYERDGAVCHVCGEHVEWADYNMDHLMPLSRGGAHVAANVAVAHRTCNQSRGNRYLKFKAVVSQPTGYAPIDRESLEALTEDGPAWVDEPEGGGRWLVIRL